MKDTCLWIEKVIDSCSTLEHYVSAYKLIDNFEKLYSAKDKTNKYKYHRMAESLRMSVVNKSKIYDICSDMFSKFWKI